MRLWLLLVAFSLWLPTTAWLFDNKNGVSKAGKGERFLDEHLPLSGYVKARGIEVDPKHQVGEDGSWDPSLSPGESRSMVIKILKRINKPSRCSKLEFSGLLSHRDAATLHSRVFTLLPDEQFNGRAAWSNGRDVLSYVYGAPANEGEAFGTWIVGDQGGIDSGFGYIKPKLLTMTPLEAHTTQGLTTSPLIQDPSLYHSSWFWLRGKDWLEATNVTLTCLDNDGADWDMHSSSPWSSFYQVQFFASDDTDALTSAFLQVSVVDGGRSGRLTFHNPDDDVGKGDKWAIGAARVIALSGVEPLCALGQPVSITLASSPHLGTAGSILPPVPNQSAPVIAHLVTDEVSGLATFRLIFRTWTIAGGPPSESSALADPEIILEVSSSLGVLGGHFISPVSEAAAAELESTDFEKLASVQQGEYVWLWWYPSSSSTTAGGSGGSSTNCPIVAEQEADELLLVCTYRAGDVAVFRRFDTDRTVQMKQSALQRDTDLWFVRFEQGQGMSRAVHWTAQARQAGTKVSSSAPETVYVSATGTVSAPQPPLCTSDVRVTHSVVIGDVKRSVAFLRHYLEYKDSQLEGQRRLSSSAALDPSEALSSCYFYHAAVSMPKAFIYAAEVLCVLQGAKPVAMIQYTSPTELQYKVKIQGPGWKKSVSCFSHSALPPVHPSFAVPPCIGAFTRSCHGCRPCRIDAQHAPPVPRSGHDNHPLPLRRNPHRLPQAVSVPCQRASACTPSTGSAPHPLPQH